MFKVVAHYRNNLDYAEVKNNNFPTSFIRVLEEDSECISYDIYYNDELIGTWNR